MVIICKISNGRDMDFGGYVLVCLSTMYMIVGFSSTKRPILSQFGEAQELAKE